MNNLHENIDYKFVIPEDDNNLIHIQVLKGRYENIVYSYGKVSMDESDNKDEAYLSFEYDIIEENNIVDDGFKDYIGDILVSILTKQLENKGEGDIFTS